jgi:hypothetical protein
MSIAEKRDAKREPWNGRAVRCVVNHLIPDMKPYPGHATDKLVLVNMARHAHGAGCGITVGKYAQADHLGCSDRRVWDAVKRLRRDGRIERTAQRTAERGSDTYRIALCQRCRVNTAAVPCQRCSPPPAATARPEPPAVSQRHPNRELQGEPSGTPVRSRRRAAVRSPNGDGGERALHPSRALPGSEADASEDAFKPSNKAREAPADNILPFKADRPPPLDHGEPSTPLYAAAPSAATGGPVLHPGRLFKSEPEQDPARWAR